MGEELKLHNQLSGTGRPSELGRSGKERVARALALAALLLPFTGSCSSGGTGTAPAPAAPSGDNGLFTLNSGAGGQPQAGGDVLAKIELSAPSQASYVVRATVPVPPGTFPRADGKLPLAIRDASGFVVPTQMEIVSRYANEADGADVVEVLGRVQRPAGVTPGTKIRYDVVDHLHVNSKLPIKKDVLGLISRPSSVLLVARDVFGNEYRFDAFDGVRDTAQQNYVKTLKQGPAAVQLRTYGAMRPQGTNLGAPTGALPHFLGVHAYTTAWALEDFLTLELRVNNGASGADKSPSMKDDDPLGDVYFQSLELWVPSGWSVVSDVSDPFLGATHPAGSWTAYELVKPNADGTMHLMPEQAMMHRRLAITRSGAVPAATAALERESLAFCVKGSSPTGIPLWSWWNPQTARYFPQRMPLPDLSFMGQAQVQGNVAAYYNTIRGHLEYGTFTGGYPWSLPNLGWAHPYGVKYGGMTSGSEIWFYDGFKTAYASSREGYRSYEFSHRMYAERQPQLLIDKDGEPTKFETWRIDTPGVDYVPMNFFQRLTNGSNDPFGMNTSPSYQRSYVAANSLKPSYEIDLLGTSPIDFQHYIRFLRSPMVLTWLGNDSLAKDDLRMAAEIFRMSYCEVANNSSGGTIPSTLLADLNSVSNRPSRGFAFGRGESWGLVSAVSAFAISDDTFRNRYRPWFGTIADLVAAGQSSCSGFIQAQINSKWLAGQWNARQSIEQAITENMLWGLKESVFRGSDPTKQQSVEQVIAASTSAMIGPMAWNGNGPWSHLAVAPTDPNQQPYCGLVPSGGGGNGNDNYQTPSSYAYGYMLTGDSTFLTRASAALAGGSTNLYNSLKGQNFNNLENKAALMALLQ